VRPACDTGHERSPATMASRSDCGGAPRRYEGWAGPSMKQIRICSVRTSIRPKRLQKKSGCVAWVGRDEEKEKRRNLLDG